jgi:hypothetical protein
MEHRCDLARWHVGLVQQLPGDLEPRRVGQCLQARPFGLELAMQRAAAHREHERDRVRRCRAREYRRTQHAPHLVGHGQRFGGLTVADERRDRRLQGGIGSVHRFVEPAIREEDRGVFRIEHQRYTEESSVGRNVLRPAMG